MWLIGVPPPPPSDANAVLHGIKTNTGSNSCKTFTIKDGAKKKKNKKKPKEEGKCIPTTYILPKIKHTKKKESHKVECRVKKKNNKQQPLQAKN